MKIIFLFTLLFCQAASHDKWDTWSPIERNGNANVTYKKTHIAKWTTFIDTRLLITRLIPVLSALRTDLKEAFEKLPRAARTAIRRHVHIYVSESFFISAEASKLYFNVTKEIEQHGCFYVYKKWKQKSRPMGEFYSDMIVELYNFDDYMTYPLNRTDALLHELAHAQHAFIGLHNPEIISNYNRVNSSRIYFNVPASNGVIVKKTYGMTSDRELFASLSVPYLRGYNDYYPFTRRQLIKHDPASFALLQQLWNMKHLIQVDRHGFNRDGGLKEHTP